MRLWNVGACILALFVVACGGDPVTVVQQEAAGTLQLPLVSSTSDGTAYRLVGATFNITGTQTVTLTDTSGDTVQTPLLAGAYTIQLASGWTMERVGAPGTAVPATLMSPNPLPFSITKDTATVVRFQFKLPGTGTADVGIVVDSGGWLAGTLHFTELDGASESSEWAQLVGKDVPFLISFASATYNRDSSRELDVETGPITVQFGGPYSKLLERAAASFQGSWLNFSLRAPGPANTLEFGGMFFFGPPDRFEFNLYPSGHFEGAVDGEGYPAVRPFQFETPMMYLRDSRGSGGVRGTASVNGSP